MVKSKDFISRIGRGEYTLINCKSISQHLSCCWSEISHEDNVATSRAVVSGSCVGCGPVLCDPYAVARSRTYEL